MKTYKYILIISLVSLLTTNCDDYLDEPISKTANIIPETVEDLDRLLNSLKVTDTQPESYFGTDDYGLRPELQTDYNTYRLVDVMNATWDRELLQDNNLYYAWGTQWSNIFILNTVIDGCSNVSGTEEEINNLKAEAHFYRAYSYFILAQVYCLPYSEATKNELGLPLRVTTSSEESVARVSLEETWKFIEEELIKGLELTKEFGSFNGLNKTWRGSKAAVNAFAARFYLSLNNYEKAQLYAQKALDIHNELIDYNTRMSYDFPSLVRIYPEGEPSQTVQVFYPVTSNISLGDNTPFLNWEESYLFRVISNGSRNSYPSESLLNLFDQDYDLRYKYHIVEHYSYDQGVTDPPVDYPGYIFFGESILSGPNVPEMVLTKAECQVRNGEWQAGIATVNLLRRVRIDASAPADVINLTANSQDEALAEVLKERRRELPFVRRWDDVRRFNNNETDVDDVVMTKTFYSYDANIINTNQPLQTYTLNKNSRKYACPIPTNDIISSKGVLKQNTY